MSNDKTILTGDVQAAIDAGSAIAALQSISPEKLAIDGALPVAVLPAGYKVEALEKHLPVPLRKRGRTTLNDMVSFIAVVNDQKKDETRLYSTVNPPTFLAVFNDNATIAGWRDHQAVYNAPLSPEWQTWLGQSGKAQTQSDFAQFIETNLPDIAEPNGADVLEVSRTLEAKKKVNFASSVRLSDGATQFTYEEDIQGTAQKGALKVPEIFVLAIPVFENGDLWRVEARLRYRIADGGKLSIWYELVRPAKVIEAAVKDLREKIAAGTGLSILVGQPS
ncbi:DUF2303 family protein [Xenophilus sp. Marseille-Q4582]|uniref:DUF2303 family protein n=1 Tax=Xenophilus sp. Marseille-Q4582 TaxID=2866600 RepID=UPI001CE48216|nr:DUF2303 family protein [Xenophilus sp. Marseille-Q4582]